MVPGIIYRQNGCSSDRGFGIVTSVSASKARYGTRAAHLPIHWVVVARFELRRWRRAGLERDQRPTDAGQYAFSTAIGR